MAHQGIIKAQQDRRNVVAYWNIPLLDGVHTVEFEHGTTSGKRVLRLNGKEILRKEWLFKLVGDIKFTVGKQQAQCELRVDPIPPFTFTYSLFVNGSPLEQFLERQKQLLKFWNVAEGGKRFLIFFEQEILELWINGIEIETNVEFTEQGTETKFYLDGTEASIKSSLSPINGEIVYNLYVNGKFINNSDYL